MKSLIIFFADRSIRPLFPAGYFYDTQVGHATFKTENLDTTKENFIIQALFEEKLFLLTSRRGLHFTNKCNVAF